MTWLRTFFRILVLELRTGWWMKAVVLLPVGAWVGAGGLGTNWAPVRLGLIVLVVLAIGSAWVRSRRVDAALATSPYIGLVAVVLAQGAPLMLGAMALTSGGSFTPTVIAWVFLAYASGFAGRARGRGWAVVLGPLVGGLAYVSVRYLLRAAIIPYNPTGSLSTPEGFPLPVDNFIGAPLALGLLVVSAVWLKRVRSVWAAPGVMAGAVLLSIPWADWLKADQSDTPPFTQVFHPFLPWLSHVEWGGHRVGPRGGIRWWHSPPGSLFIVRPQIYLWPGAFGLATADGSALECPGEPGFLAHVLWRGDNRALFVRTPTGWLSADVDTGCGTRPPGGLGWLGSERVWTEGDAVVVEGRTLGTRDHPTILSLGSVAAGFSGAPGQPHCVFTVREEGLVDLDTAVVNVEYWTSRPGGVCAKVRLAEGCDASSSSRDVVSEPAPPDPQGHRCAEGELPAPTQWTCWRLADGRSFVHPLGGYPVDVALSATNPGLLNLETGAPGVWPGADTAFRGWRAGQALQFQDQPRRVGSVRVSADGAVMSLDRLLGY